MDVFHSAWDYVREYNGEHLQAALIRNIDFLWYGVTLYVLAIVKGPVFFRWLFGGTHPAAATAEKNGGGVRRTPLDHVIMAWHMLLVAVAVLTLAFTVPVWLDNVARRGIYETTCVWKNELVFSGPVGFWLAVHTLSKVLALLDVVLAVVRNSLRGATDPGHSGHQRIPFHEWYYQSLIAFYCWHTYSLGMTYFMILAILNALAQAVVYVCKTLQDIQTLRDDPHGGGAELRSLTSMYILTARAMECLLSILVAMSSSYNNYYGSKGCLIMQANARMCTVMYVSCLCYMYSDLKEVMTRKISSAKKRE